MRQCIYRNICKEPEMGITTCAECSMRDFGYVPEIIEETRCEVSDITQEESVLLDDDGIYTISYTKCGIDKYGVTWQWEEDVQASIMFNKDTFTKSHFRRYDDNLTCELDDDEG